jgi:transcriptional regulator with XRE-family HTH domain
MAKVVADSELLALGRGIRSYRLQRGYSQEQLAERADLHRNYIGLVERGERNASAKALIQIARALTVHPADLWSELPRR